MTTQDDDFGRRVSGYLDKGAASMRAGTAYRLQLARQAALERLAAPERVVEPRLAGAMAGGGRASGGHGLWTSGKLWLGIAVVALAAFSYQGYQHWEAQQRLKDLTDTDVAILSSDLPIDAYLDRGFQNWLKHDDDQ